MLNFKRDKFRERRGNYSRMLNINCGACNTQLIVYQKDGPGNLRRLYLDRMVETKNLSQGKNQASCKKCGETLGVPIVYKKENRKAIRLFQDAVTKKIRKLN